MDRTDRLTGYFTCLAVTLFFALVLVPRPATAMQGKQLLDDLIAKAKKEGSLDTAFVSEAGPANPALIQAFKKRFGLENLEVNVAVGNQPRMFAQLKAQLSAGVPPTLDSITGSEENVSEALGAGRVVPIENWQLLLAEINPLVRSGKVKPGDISPGMFAGQSFIWGNRVKALVYNPKVISEQDLPKTHLDIANPKYKGKYVVPPWIDEWLLGMLVYKDKAKWLGTVDQIGKNALGVLHLTSALQRLLLGDIAFMPGNGYHYFQAKGKDPTAPVEVTYWSDYTGITRISYAVTKGARHPAAAALWNLWMTTPEAEAIWQPIALYSNVSFGQSDYDKKVRDKFRQANSPVISFYENDETRKELAWLGTTEEGIAYRNSIVQAATQRQQKKKSKKK